MLSPNLRLIDRAVHNTLYGFEYYRGGTRVRRWFEQGGEVHFDEGPSLAEEVEVFRATDDGERRVLNLLGRLALPVGRLDEVEYDLYELAR